MMTRLPVLALPLLGVACSFSLPFGMDDRPDGPEISVIEAPGDDIIRPRARISGTADATPTPAAPAPQSDGFLGETLAGLGAPSEAGRWLSTGLVDSPRPGRVVTQDGQSLTLELRPSGAEPGAGSQISLAAMQTLGLNLAQLATLRVFVN